MTTADTRGVVGAQDPALFEVTNRWTNSPVGPGEVLEVHATIENVGGETGRTDVELIVGYSPEVEDRRMLTLAPGERRTITLEFRAGDPSGGHEEFPVRVDTGAHSVTEMVTVTTWTGDPALFEVDSVWTNSPVGASELLEVYATIENVGDETGRTDIELIVGYSPEVEDSRMLTLAPGERRTIILEFRAGDPSGGREEFPVEVDTGAHSVTEMVAVVE
ncbi:COG1361 family protein [Halopiger aswanensis]|uniref:hypothetical protein n=1 Tax=Halopiger aswanensis TaxID=148449 RepID=UPI001FE60B9D|nr:hypothetical protein [Halopiger aswanensis]